MIVKNEEKFLEECLQSVQGVADEIVVVDTGSTDATREIAARYGAKVLEFTWVGDFSAARNFSLQHCTGDWVLYLDADERFAEGQGKLLHELVSAKGVGAYNVMIENPHSLHQGLFVQENAYPRLFRRAPGVRFEGKVHEQIWPSLQRQRLVVRQSELVVKHLGYAQGYDVVRLKAERNMELLRKQVGEDPDDAYALFQIGNSLVILQRYDEAEPVLERAVKNSRLSAGNRATGFNLLAEVQVRKGNLPGASEFCRKSLQLAPGQVMAHWFLSLIHFDLGEYATAIDALTKAEQALCMASSSRSNQISSDLDLKKEDVMKRFVVTYEAAGRYREAAERSVRWLELVPRSDEARQAFLRNVERIDEPSAAIGHLLSVAKNSPGRNALFLPLARHYRKLNDVQKAEEYINKSIDGDPGNPEAYLLSARWKMESGNRDEAEGVVSLAESREIHSFELHKLGLQLSLEKGDVGSAFRHLEFMTRTTSADLTPLKNRITALAQKLSAFPR